MRIKREKKKEKCNQKWIMIIRKDIIRILIIKITESTLDSKEASKINHNDGLIINNRKWNGYDKFRIDDLRNWLIQNDFIGMENHYYTLFYGIHTLELILNQWKEYGIKY